MAERRHFRDNRIENTVTSSAYLMSDIIRNCDRGDYKKPRVLLVGQTGSGKSSVINTIRKVITGEYVQVAQAGGGDVHSNTLQMNWYPNCGVSADDFRTSDHDFVYRRQQKEFSANDDSFKCILDKLPDLFDVAGMADSNSDETKEILRLLIGGYITPDTDISELERLQREKGEGYLSWMYSVAKEEYKMSVVLFVCACGSPIPHNLIKCVRDVLAEAERRTLYKRFDADMFVLLTKYDDVDTSHLSNVRKQNAVKQEQASRKVHKTHADISEGKLPDEGNTAVPMSAYITWKEFENMENDVARAFVITGLEDDNRLRWISYNNSIGYNDPHIDDTSLKLLKFLTRPRFFQKRVNHKVELEKEIWDYVSFHLHKFAKYVLLLLRKLAEYLSQEIRQHYQVDIPELWFLVGASIVVMFLAYIVLSFSFFVRS